MYDKHVATILNNKTISIKGLNTVFANMVDHLSADYKSLLSLNYKLDRLIKFKQGRIDFYKNRISDIISLFDKSLNNRYQRITELNFNNLHFIDQANTTAHVDTDSKSVRINETDTSYRIPVESILTDDNITTFVVGSGLDSSFLEYGVELKNLFIDYYNYYRYIARSRSKTPYTFNLSITFPEEQSVSILKFYLDNIVPFVDTITVSYTNESKKISSSQVYSDFLPGPTVEVFIGDVVKSVNIQITKFTNDDVVFDAGVAYFDYYFTIRKMEFFNRRYYRSNTLVTKPMFFGNSELGVMRNSVKLRSETTKPLETDVKFFYSRVARGVMGNVLDYDETKLAQAIDGQEIKLLDSNLVVHSATSKIYKSFSPDYVYLDTTINVPKILNGSINVFKGVDKYITVDENFYRFWLVRTEDNYIDVNLSNYVSDFYLDTKKIETRGIKLGRGSFKVAVYTDDLLTFVEYLAGLDSTMYLVKEKLLFGLPSKVLPYQFDKSFTLWLKPDRINADILVSLPPVEELSESYLILYDTRKKEV